VAAPRCVGAPPAIPFGLPPVLLSSRRRHLRRHQAKPGGAAVAAVSPRLDLVGGSGARTGCTTDGAADGDGPAPADGRWKRQMGSIWAPWAWMGLGFRADGLNLGPMGSIWADGLVFLASTTSSVFPRIFTLHEGVWGICPKHGGGGRLFRQR
jgi:hypothetical protein